MVDEVLPDVAYVGLVFTIPKMLRRFLLWDRSLYGELCRCAYRATRKFFEAQFPALENAVAAMVVSPQSWGSLLNFHPHAHSLCSLGVFTPDGVFHPAPHDIDFTALEELFRDETLKMMLKKDVISEERVNLLRSWRHSGFHLNAGRRIAAGERKELESLLEYIERPPVSLKRLTYQDDARVLYKGNYNPSLGRDYQLSSALEFLAMLVPHIALRYECRIHCYGAISTTIRRQLGWMPEQDKPQEGPQEIVVAEEEESDFVRLRKKNWRRLIAKVWLEDPQVCTGCGKEMKVISAISSPHQDEVIEKVLKARGLWDPPWLRERKARGPPPQAADKGASSQPSSQSDFFSQLRAQSEEEDFSQLPPGGDDAL